MLLYLAVYISCLLSVWCSWFQQCIYLVWKKNEAITWNLHVNCNRCELCSFFKVKRDTKMGGLGPFCQCCFLRCFFMLLFIFGVITYLELLHVEKEKQHLFGKSNNVLKIAKWPIFKTLLLFPKRRCFWNT